SMLVSIFYEPSRVFRAIKEKSHWIIPFVIILLSASVTAYIVTPITMAEQMEKMRTNPDMTEEQKQQAEKGMEMFASPVAGVAMALIFTTFIIFCYTGVTMLFANVIFGGKARFAQVFSMIIVSSMIWVISSIVKAPLILAKNSVDIRTSPAMILPGDATESALYHFLNTYMDIFFLWQTILIIIGVKIIYEFATQKAAMAVLIPTVVMALFTTTLSAIF
ncbi:MAG: YIP1 family protein, partial [Candidatus Zixiibacteriota bacterium]